ncbi:hypothetical protein BX589_101102 [Paraburkholderia fungorum]|jgi:hypothetical protein|uniref:hypothetical protein n=1 Tax=Paraburkholderia fungorum TaxID=134537 RepID=UPI000D07C9A6|nr:hypothetical protein [Paraburkholderia fungorum]PRZ56452.1 hypothetical protein BX589_101102 [Paraburkholderia fungorum]
MTHRKQQLQHRFTRKFTPARPTAPADHAATATTAHPDFQLPESDAELRELVSQLCRKISVLRDTGARLADDRQRLEARHAALASELVSLNDAARDSDPVRAQAAERDAQWALAQQHAVQGQIAHTRSQEGENEEALQKLCGQRLIAMGEAEDRNPDAPFIVSDHAIVRYFERFQGVDARALIRALAPHLGPASSDHYLLELLRHYAGVDVDAIRDVIGNCRVRARAKCLEKFSALRDVPIGETTGLLARVINNTVVTVIPGPGNHIGAAPSRVSSPGARARRERDERLFDDAPLDGEFDDIPWRAKSTRTRARRERDKRFSENAPFAPECWFAERVLGDGGEVGEADSARASADNVVELWSGLAPEGADVTAANVAVWRPLVSLLTGGDASDGEREAASAAQAIPATQKPIGDGAHAVAA